MRRSLLLLLPLPLLLSSPAHAGDARFPPAATRKAVIGCWDAGDGVTLTLTPYGKHSVWSEARFSQRPKGGPKKMSALAAWHPSDGELELSCRPRSQHGTVCRVSPDGNGGLRVRVFSLRSKALTADFVATAVACPK